MALDFSIFFQRLKTEVTQLANKTVKNYVTEATADGEHILDELKEQLQIWTKQVEEGNLRIDDFEYNLLSGKDLVVMAGLKQKGLAMVEMDRFKNSIFKIITETVKSLIP